MRTVLRHALALAGATLLLGSGCAGKASTTTEAGAPTSSLPPPTTLVSTTTAPTTPPTTVPAGPAVAEAGGWRIAITAPTALATIGPALDLCYEATGVTEKAADIAFEVSLVLAATGTVAAKVRVDGTAGRGVARVGLAGAEPRRYDMGVQAFVNGQRIEELAVVVRGVMVGAAPPAGCG